MKYKILFIIAVFNCQILWGQQYVEVHPSIGTIIRQNTDIAFKAEKPSIGLMASYTFKTDGSKKWHKLRGFPQINLNFVYYNLGDAEILGHALGVYPSISMYIVNRPKYKLLGRFGWGIGYITKKYNRKTNAKQNAIGSNFNILPGFHIINTYQLNSKTNLYQSFSLIHFSNASFKKPNLGINILALDIGVQYEISSKIKPHNRRDTISPRRLYGGITVGGGLREFGKPDGPKYMITFASLSLQYAFKKHLLNIGVDLEQNDGIYNFARHTQQFETQEDALIASRRKAIYLADEILFGRLGVWLQWGFYIDKSNSFLLGGNHYFKLGSRYHFPLDKKGQRDIHIGFYMKSHKIIAEYFSLAIGVRL